MLGDRFRQPRHYPGRLRGHRRDRAVNPGERVPNGDYFIWFWVIARLKFEHG